MILNQTPFTLTICMLYIELLSITSCGPTWINSTGCCVCHVVEKYLVFYCFTKPQGPGPFLFDVGSKLPGFMQTLVALRDTTLPTKRLAVEPLGSA